jgi:periplasmic protein TonB
MAGGTVANRSGRKAVAAGVVLAHALLVWVAVTRHLDRAQDETAAPPVLVTTMFELPPVQSPPSDPQPLDRPRLQEFSPQEISVDQLQIDAPEVDAPAPAVVAAETANAAPPQAGGSAGQSSGGDGLVLVQRALPAYPRAAARRGEQGITQVILHVTPAGSVDQVKVEQTSGSALLDAAAVEAFRKWRFARLPDGSAGRWLRTAQRFILYQFTYSRLDAEAMEFVYGENLKPKPGVGENATPGSQNALLRFMAQLRDPAFAARGAVSAKELAAVRANLARWGATKSVEFMGIVGSGPWLRHGINSALHPGRDTVELSWNMFEVRHENATSQWLIAMDHDGQVWAARVGQTSWMNADHG